MSGLRWGAVWIGIALVLSSYYIQNAAVHGRILDDIEEVLVDSVRNLREEPGILDDNDLDKLERLRKLVNNNGDTGNDDGDGKPDGKPGGKPDGSQKEFKVVDDPPPDRINLEAKDPQAQTAGGGKDTVIVENGGVPTVMFIAVVVGCSVAGFVALIAAGVCWYKLQSVKSAASEGDYAGGVRPPVPGSYTSSIRDKGIGAGDRKLAKSAQMYHYQHQKQQMLALEKASDGIGSQGSELDSEDETEEGEYTVYECPGLAPTGEMEVKNPLFNGDSIPNGFSKLYSLEFLDASSNEISQILEVEHLGNLPCLENVNLVNNSVTIVVDYRTKVLEIFNDRAKELTLDGVRPSQKELDTVAVLLAIQKSRKSKEKKTTRVPAREVPIAEPCVVTVPAPTGPQQPAAAPAGASQPETATEVTEENSVYESAYTHHNTYIPPPTNSQTSSSSHHQHVSSSNASSSNKAPEIQGKDIRGTPDNGSEEYRREVERIQAQGGTEWLTILNQMHRQEEASKDSKSEPKEHAHSFRYHYDEKQQKKIKEEIKAAGGGGSSRATTTTESDSSTSTDEGSIEPHSSVLGSYEMYTEASFMLPESMPGRNDSTFLQQLQVMIPDPQVLSKRAGGSGGSTTELHREERPVHLMWASVVRYNNPYREFPACVYITTEHIHILEVKALTSDFEIPQMSHYAYIPLMNVQQIALGHHNMYIRIEEAFVGPSGTFTFLTSNAGKTDLMLDSLKLAYRRAAPDLDQYEDPHVVVNSETETNLKQVLAKIEQVKEEKVEIELYMLVNARSNTHTGLIRPPAERRNSYTCHSLVITSRCVCLLREDYIFWPQPTFALGPSTRPQFEPVTVFPIHSKISTFQMYDSDTCSPEKNQSLAATFSATNTSAMLTPNFIGYGVKLQFEVGKGLARELDIRVSTPSDRNKFLEALTTARGKLQKAPHKVRFRMTDHDKSSESTASGSEKISRAKRRSKSKYKDYKKEKMTKQKLQKSPDLGSVNEQFAEVGEFVYPHSTITLDKTEDSYFKNFSSSASESNVLSVRVTEETSSVEGSSSSDNHTGGAIKSKYKPPDSLPVVLQTSAPPSDLILSSYPSIELLRHLTESVENVCVLQPLSPASRNLANMTGEEVLNFFHSRLSQIGKGDEELRHVLWTEVVPYINARQTLVTCVMISTKAVYFISDDSPKQSAASLKYPWRKHTRYRSDISSIKFETSLLSSKSKGRDGNKQAMHNTSAGIVHNEQSSDSNKTLKAYCVLPLKELHRVHVGLFDHSFRLSGKDTADTVHCCVTRDSAVTETFMRYLMSVLSLINPTPSPQTPQRFTESGSEQDFYKMFRDRTYSRSLSESLEYVHPSRVRFVYPSDDVVSDLIYVIRDNMKGKIPKAEDTNILCYMLCYKEKAVVSISNRKTTLNAVIDIKTCDPRTVVLTENHLTLAVEDYVSYPLPDFAKEPPIHKQHVVLEVRSLEHLKRVVVSDFSSHDLTLIFADESDEVLVDSALEYYTPRSGAVAKTGKEFPEVSWTLVVQNMEDKERLIKLMGCQWAEVHGGKLSVQVNT